MGVLRSLDERLLRVARTRCHAPQVEHAVIGFSRTGEHGAVWLALGAVGHGADPVRRPCWRRALRAVALAYAFNTALKLAARRRRPQLAGLPPLTGTPSGLGFPSAHASTSFAGALAYSRLGLPRAALYALALGLAASRAYLGVHYPSDLLGGAALGTVVGRAFGPPPRRRRRGAVSRPPQSPTLHAP